MKINNRLFTYPILSENNNDYVNGSFDVEVSHKMIDVLNLQLKFDIKMNCDALKDLINKGFAKYVIHIECS